MTNDELLHKWVEKTISAQELEIFKARPEYDSLVKLYEQTESLTTPKIDGNSMLENIFETAQKPKEATIERKIKRRSLLPIIGIAASLLLLAGFFLLSDTSTSLQNNNQGQMAESLPDGSNVTLYANSNIEFTASKWDEERAINLDGKAFFDVVKGERFTVKSQKGIVEVLGTQFLVDNQDESYEVSCTEGKVKVNSLLSSAKAILAEGDSFIVFDNGSSILRQQEQTKVKNISLENVLSEVKSVFDVNIENSNIDLSQKLTTGFQNDNLENAIKTICMALQLEYEIEGKSITLKNR